jgi:cobalt-zinc-cadmium efflux system membrane fusion protein
MKATWKVLLALTLIAAGATGLMLNKGTRGHVVNVWHKVAQVASHGEEPPPDKSWQSDVESKSKVPWDRTLTLTADQIKAIGLETARVERQAAPTVLQLFGTTDYDPATVTIVRTQFDSRVDRVLVDLGTPVTIGTELIELFSTDLAAAKSEFEMASSQWNRDKRVLEYKTPLAESNTLPKKELIEIQNDEAQSRLKMKLAKDKLLVYGLTEQEIEKAKTEDGVQKAKMILRSTADGVVVKRSVVRGNWYDSKDELMVIAPLDHLWVRGSVSELDAEKVEVGQNLRVVFPFSVSDREITSQVKYIDKAIDPDTRSAKFRTTIPNPGGRLKAGAFVKVLVEIPPKEGRTVIPRSAMVSVDRSDYVFVQKPGTTNQYERRPIFVAKESNDIVIVAEPTEGHGELTPGEIVVTTGSLILEQKFEDRVMEEGGLLAARPGEDTLQPGRGSKLVIVTEPSKGR